MIEKILYHYKNPKNKGKIDDADIVIKEAIPSCGDLVIFYYKIKGYRITDVKFEGFGCITTIALADIISELLRNKSISFIKNIDQKFIEEILGGKLPREKEHSIALILNSLRKLIKNYERNFGKIN